MNLFKLDMIDITESLESHTNPPGLLEHPYDDRCPCRINMRCSIGVCLCIQRRSSDIKFLRPQVGHLLTLRLHCLI